MAKTTSDKFAAAVMKELEKYAAEDIPEKVDTAVDVVTKAGVRTLRSVSKSTFKKHTGEYASGWTVTKEGDRLDKRAVIHNTHPGLPHLLEYGHANRGGGRTPGRTHIKPVEEEMIREFEKEIEKEL